MNPRAKLLRHGDRLRSWFKGEVSLPILVEIAPTNSCNASCPWCDFKGKHGTININKAIMLSTLKELIRTGVKAINWTGGGEPTLHPNFNEFVAEAHRLGIEQGLFTNAYTEIENPEVFKWIRISLTDEEFEPIQRPGGHFGICVNMLITTSGKKLREWCKYARDMGASYFQVRPALQGNYKKQSFLLPPGYLKEYETRDFKVILSDYKFMDATKPHGYSRCYGYHFCPSIDWCGKVGVCLYRMDEEKYVFGDLNKQTFTAIWHHKRVAEGLVNGGCQNCCKNHEINKLLFEAKHVKEINFL